MRMLISAWTNAGPASWYAMRASVYPKSNPFVFFFRWVRKLRSKICPCGFDVRPIPAGWGGYIRSTADLGESPIRYSETLGKCCYRRGPNEVIEFFSRDLVNARQFSRLALRWRVDHDIGFGSTSRTAIGDLYDLSAMTVQDPLPIFGLKIGVTGGCLLIFVIKDRADQVQ